MDRKHFSKLSSKCVVYSARVNRKRYYFHVKRCNDDIDAIACISKPGGTRIPFPEGFSVSIVQGNRRYPSAKLDEWYIMAASSNHELMYKDQVLLKFQPLKLRAVYRPEYVDDKKVVLESNTTTPKEKVQKLLENVMY